MEKSDSNTTKLSMADILLKSFLAQNLGPAADYLPSTVSGMSGLSKGMRGEFFKNEVSPSNLVHSIDADLRDTTKYNYDEMEIDALRHYLGMQGLVEKYGDTIAWIAGILHEGTDLVIPGEAGIQSQIDRENNNIALSHANEGINIKVEDLDNYEKLQKLLSVLVIPPPYGEVSTPEPGPQKQFNPETYNTGYHPELDQNN